MKQIAISPSLIATALMLALASPTSISAQTTNAASKLTQPAPSFDIPITDGDIHVSLSADDTVHLQPRVHGKPAARSLVIDPALQPAVVADATMHTSAGIVHLDTPAIRVSWDRKTNELTIADAHQHALLHTRDLNSLAKGSLKLTHAPNQPIYGLSSTDAFDMDVSAGMLRQGKLVVKAGEQGWTGAPLAWSTAGYGVLADMKGGTAQVQSTSLALSNASHMPMDVYVAIGKPAAIFADVAALSGRSPLFPKWAMGFTNSQWGIDEKELLHIVQTYRDKHIPIDNFTLDFDWKAWGKDNGEFRWNPVKFPDGPSGKLTDMLHAQGMQLTGIMKPRVHLDTVEGRYATAHDFWIPGEKASDDYFSHKPVKDIDFDKPAARRWFGNLAVKYGFEKGMEGWWNDEADTTGSDTQFLNMQRGLYDAQREVSDKRVWSINRDFYLGAQRYAYGVWSGDIATGFASMANQRARMLSAIDVGAMQWGMDGGGFNKGHPSDENYARWIEFGAFTPIFRVHGNFDEKRQPWKYGPIAEAAATAAIRLRYSLIPYIYSYEYQRRHDGVGLVTPLTFDWPNDPKLRNDVSSWMFGNYLLISPVVKQGQTEKSIYLPSGDWINWFSGKHFAGGQTISHAVDATDWGDIPLYIRQGAIIPMQPPMDYVGQKPLTEVSVEVFPGTDRSHFNYYDDDGSTYAYEHGDDFRQTLSVQRTDNTVAFDTTAAAGSYKPALNYYLLKIHGHVASKVVSGSSLRSFPSFDALEHGNSEGWSTGKDRFGPVTYVRLNAGVSRHITLSQTP